MKIDRPAPGQIPALRALWKEAFGDSDAFLDCFFATAFSPHRCRCLWQAEQPAAALYWFDCAEGGRKFAYLYAVATAPSFRGQGLCRALMADTHAFLADAGYAGAILVPGEPALFAMYEKMGYSVFSGMDTLSCPAGEKPVKLREATPVEYALARRKYLPAGGVLQDGPSLAFLSRCAQLYIGPDFALAAEQRDGSLFGMELLGDPNAAPGILAALCLEKGTFRIPGSRPFAMYHPLTAAAAPAYFGLAFD